MQRLVETPDLPQLLFDFDAADLHAQGRLSGDIGGDEVAGRRFHHQERENGHHQERGQDEQNAPNQVVYHASKWGEQACRLA